MNANLQEETTYSLPKSINTLSRNIVASFTQALTKISKKSQYDNIVHGSSNMIKIVSGGVKQCSEIVTFVISHRCA